MKYSTSIEVPILTSLTKRDTRNLYCTSVSPFLNVTNYGLLIGLILKYDYAILAHPVITNSVEYCEFI